MNRIVVIGSANADYNIQVQRRPLPGETVRGDSLVVSAGGKGANQAAAAALLGGDVAFFGCIGNDGAGDILRSTLSETGVDVSCLEEAETNTGAALIVITPDGENSIIIAPGANQHMTPQTLQKHPDIWKGTRLVSMQLEIPMETVEYVAKECGERGIQFVLNAAPSAPLSVEVLKCCDPLIVNESEAKDIVNQANITDPVELIQTLKSMGPKSVVLTLGSAGSLCLEVDGKPVFQPASKVKAVDTTGAGDCFIGGLIVKLAGNEGFLPGMILGTKAAAYAVQRPGAIASYPAAEDLA